MDKKVTKKARIGKRIEPLRIDYRINIDQRDIIKKAAELEKLSIADFVLKYALKSAEHIVKNSIKPKLTRPSKVFSKEIAESEFENIFDY